MIAMMDMLSMLSEENTIFLMHNIYQKKLSQQMIKPYRTTFILKLWKLIETILVSHI